MQPTKFVRMWMASKTNAQIAKEFNVSEPTVSNYARKLKDLGVQLPERDIRRGEKKINVEALNELIERES